MHPRSVRHTSAAARGQSALRKSTHRPAVGRREASEFARTESEVRYYCRAMPAVFTRAVNARLWAEDGAEYIDFLSACGAQNFGHNHPFIKGRVAAYLAGDGVLNALDLHTSAKADFLHAFRTGILEPRGLSYRLQFPGPTGTNAVEAALKLARKATGRRAVVSFTNAFHGMTLGALAVSGNRRGAAADDVIRLPFDGSAGAGIEELQRFEAMANDPSGGLSLPAAFLVETVQGEGGLNVAGIHWLRELAALAKRLGALLIVDDIQAGCGRTGSYFSFERAGIAPDIICLAKSISGIGLPMALVLISPDHDRWAPGEHNGTFRGNNLAFVGAAAALEAWQSPSFQAGMQEKGERLRAWAEDMTARYSPFVSEVRGLGWMLGLGFDRPDAARLVAGEAVASGVLIETAGPKSEVLKLFPPLTIEPELLEEGLCRIEAAIRRVCEASAPLPRCATA